MERVVPGTAVIEQDARVVAVGDGLAWVEARRASSCGSCSAAAGCGTSVVAKLFGEGVSRIAVTDPIGVQVGDPVVIGIAGSAVTRASLLAYLLPLIVMILLAFAAQRAGAGEGLTAVLGMLGLVLGLWGCGRLVGHADADGRYRPRLRRKRFVGAAGRIAAPVSGCSRGISGPSG